MPKPITPARKPRGRRALTVPIPPEPVEPTAPVRASVDTALVTRRFTTRRPPVPGLPAGTWPSRLRGCHPLAVARALETAEGDWMRLQPGDTPGSVIVS